MAIQESDLKWKQGTGTVELSDAAFDAAAVACARQAAKKSGLGYQLMMNREFPVLYFVFSDNVLLMVYGTKTEKNGNGAEQAQQKEEKTIAEKAKNAGNFAIGAGVLALANEYGSAYEIPMLLVLGVAAGAAVVAVDAVKGAAGYAMDEIAPGRHDAEASVISMSDLVLGAKKMEMRDRNDDIVGYTDGTVSVADISTFRFHAKWGFLPADEDLTVAGKIGRTTSMGFIEVQKTSNPGEADAIGFTSYEPSLYNIKSVEPYVHWYGTANFNRIKQCLESRNVEYMLIFQPMSSNLIFLTNDNTAICMQAIDAGSSISALNEISMGEQLKYWQRENAARKQ